MAEGGGISVYIGTRGAAVVAAVVALAAGVFAVPVITGGGSGEPGLANIWVQQGSGACAGGSSGTPIAFEDAASPDRICGSFDAACQAMGNGQLALVKGSTSFGAQTLSSSCNGASGSEKRICTAPGESVVITAAAAVDFANSDYVIICGNAEGWQANSSTYGQFRWEATAQNNATAFSFDPGTTGSGIDGVEADANGYGGDDDVTACSQVCKLFGVYAPGGTTDIQILNSDLCCNADKLIFPDNNGTPNDAWLIEGNYLHDQVQLTVDGGAHYECYYGNGTTNTVIRGNVWNVCRATGHMNHTCLGGCEAGAEPANITVENNIFLRALEAETDNEHNPSIDGCLQCVGFVRYHYNLIYNGVALYNNGVNRVVGNIISGGGVCTGGTTYANNIFTGGSGCGTGAVVNSTIFSNNSYWADASRLASLNWCPTGANPALGAGNDTTFPITDILGRPRSADIDSGPYEGTC